MFTYSVFPVAALLNGDRFFFEAFGELLIKPPLFSSQGSNGLQACASNYRSLHGLYAWSGVSGIISKVNRSSHLSFLEFWTIIDN